MPQDLDAIERAALEYKHADQDDEEWPTVRSDFYVIAADPDNILEMVQELKARRALPSQEEMRAMGKLIRDMAGYIKLMSGDKPDHVRDDLLLQTRQLLGLTGL